MRILLADDDPMSLQLTSFYLHKHGYEVVLANNGQEALEYLLAHDDIHLLISDWYMPVLDGIELCRKLRDPDFPRYVYTVLLTSNQETDSLIEGMDAGADDFMHKPLKEKELRVRVRAGERLLELKHKLNRHNRELQDTNAALNSAYQTIRQDLEMAASIQQALLPKPGQFGHIDIQWLFMPSHFIGGDMLGYFFLDEQHLAFYQLDVVGHGTSSALQSFMINQTLSNDLTRDTLLKTTSDAPPFCSISPPDTVAERLNDHVAADKGTDFYFTMVYAIAELHTNTLAFTQAGHPHPIVQRCSDMTVDLVGHGGFPIGILDDSIYTAERLHMDAGDRIFLYSDGITECHNPAGDMYTEERLLAFLRQHMEQPLSHVIQSLGHELRNWKESEDFQDDITMLALEWGHPA